MSAPVSAHNAIAVIEVTDGLGVARRFIYAMREVRLIEPGGDVNAGAWGQAEARLRGVPQVSFTAADEVTFEGLLTPTYGALELANEDGELDDWDSFLWALTGTVKVYEVTGEAAGLDYVYLAEEPPYSDTMLLVASVEDARIGELTTTLALRDTRDAIMRRPFHRTTFRGYQHAVKFDGTDDHGVSATFLPTAAMTWELWLRCNDRTATARTVFAHGDVNNAANQDVTLELNAGQIRFVIHNFGTGCTSSYVTLPGKTSDDNHVAVVVAAGADACKLIINGIERATATLGAARATMVTKIAYFGAGVLTRYAPVTLNDVRTYGYARTASEVKAQMRDYLQGDETSLTNHWRHTDGAGTAVANSVTGGATVTLVNGPTWVSGAEGTPDMAGTPKQRIVGVGLNVECVCVDPLRLIYLIGDGPLGDLGLSVAGGELFFEVRDKGSVITKGTAFDDLDGLLVSTPGASTYNYSLRHGLAKLQTSPSGTVTADTYGECLHTTSYWETLTSRPNYYGIRFNGTTQYGTAPTPWSSLATDFTFATWFRFTGTGTGAIMGNLTGATAGRRYMRVALDASGLFFLNCGVYNDTPTEFSAPSAVGSVIPNRWNHGLMRWTAATKTLRLYLNGVLVATTVATGAFAGAPAASTYIGQSGAGTTYFTGDIAWTQWWTAAAVGPENFSMMSRALSDTVSPPNDNWTFSEGTGTTVASGVGTITLSLFNTPTWVPGAVPDFAAAILQVFVGTESAAGGIAADYLPLNETFLALPTWQLTYPSAEAGATVGGLLNKLLVSLGAALVPRLTGIFSDFLDVIRLARPGYEWADGGSAETVSTVRDVLVLPGSIDGGITPLKTSPPVGTIFVGYRPIGKVQAAGELNTTVSAADRLRWSKDQKWIERHPVAVAAYVDLAAVHRIETMIVRQPDATSRTIQLEVLYGRPRRTYTLHLSGTVLDVNRDELATIPIGYSADLSESAYERFDVPADPKFRVIAQVKQLGPQQYAATAVRF